MIVDFRCPACNAPVDGETDVNVSCVRIIKGGLHRKSTPKVCAFCKVKIRVETGNQGLGIQQWFTRRKA